MKYWKCLNCSRQHISNDEVVKVICPECLNKMGEVDYGERKD